MHDRLRSWRSGGGKVRRSGRAAPEPVTSVASAPEVPPPPPPFEPLPVRTVSAQPEPQFGSVTSELFSRLTPEDVKRIEESLTDDERTLWDAAAPINRQRLALAYGLFHDVDGIASRTGLSAATPPQDVHFMGRGMVEQTGGAYFYADMVAEFLDSTGRPLQPGHHVLDYSCSSGRVIRALAAAQPDLHCYGCDPNAPAIAWAQASLPAIDFFTSPTVPPLTFDDASLDVVFAISVWSHYSASAALGWLDEMHRVIRPGGCLILTTHGINSCVWFSYYRDPAIEARLGPAWITTTAHRLQQDGHVFWDVFGPSGDFGVVDQDWGLAFFTPEWLANKVTPKWAITQYRVGRADGNQDAFVLERR
jgi:SAM-dependent methyltransferase